MNGWLPLKTDFPVIKSIRSSHVLSNIPQVSIIVSNLTAAISRKMLSIPLILATLFAFLGAQKNGLDSHELFGIPADMWHCGSEEMSVQLALSYVSKCPEHAEHFNHCCAVHDDCYTNQMGQVECDQKFCDCNNEVIGEEKNSVCSEYSLSSCVAVQLFGAPAYGASLHSNLPLPPLPIGKRRIPSIKKIAWNYVDLYEKCPFQNVTFASCALNHDLCLKKNQSSTEEKCALRLIECLDETKSGRERDCTCDAAIETLLSKLISTDEETDPHISIDNGTITMKKIMQIVHEYRVSLPDGAVILLFVAAGLLTLISCIGIFAAASKNLFEEEHAQVTATSMTSEVDSASGTSPKSN